MKLWFVAFLLGTTVAVVGGTSGNTMDQHANELIISNDKLDEIKVQYQKVGDFLKRWGYFYGYCVPPIEWLYHEFGTEHEHTEEHGGTMILETDVVGQLETLNGYLDWVIDTEKMASIV